MAEGLGLPGTIEFAFKYKTFEYWGDKLRLELSGNLKAGGATKAGLTHTSEHERGKSNKESVLKGAVEAEIRGFEVELEGRVNEEKLIKALGKGDIRAMCLAIVGAQASHGFKPKWFDEIQLSLDIGVDVNAQGLPLLLKGKGSWAPKKFNPPLQCVVEVEGHVGPSLKGWMWIGRQVGKESLVRFCQEEGLAGTLDYLVANGIVTIAASALSGLVGTMVLVSFAQYMTSNARNKGARDALMMGYRRGFLDALFPRVGKGSIGFGLGGSQDERDAYAEMYKAGKRDALKHAGDHLAKLQRKMDMGSDDEMRASSYGELLRQYYRSQGRDAEAEIGVNLQKKMERLSLSSPSPSAHGFGH